ncbi:MULTISPECIES: hypothetical protein [unclassified Duganella]|uniref:hypothetical protein n=1 Tax=unclassified Duganella TaxID=2636909 RepID=UPI000E341B66|nr:MULTISPECIES: hypothetical protein [unclassified Duganella]RFP09361.1 hypothetical protein D0T23_27035 [Duganella sp. BJB475]RFP25397.1 hypothetical protein D0T21_28065 [Duganella sp. BJB476]
MHAAVRYRYPVQLFTLLWLLLVGSAASAQVDASHRLDDVVACGLLRVGTTGDHPPYSFRTTGSDDFFSLDIELAGGARFAQRDLHSV